MTATPISTAQGAAREWLEDLDDTQTAIDVIDACAREVARELALSTHPAPVIPVLLVPRNGWEYKIVLTVLGPLASASWGGNLLVSLPEFHRSTLLEDNGGVLHFPSYIDEKMTLGPQHSAVIAAFLTVLSDYRSVPTPD